jgi:translocator protein
MMNKWLALAAFLAVTFLASLIGGLATDSGPGSWYAGLEKPPWNPPSWVFGPVWTVLYLAMAVAAWRVWRRDGPLLRLALTLYFVQLALNLGWSLIFFGLESPGLAFAEIVVLACAIAATMFVFFRIDRPAGWLFVPYLAWVVFAAALNLSIWRLNA